MFKFLRFWALLRQPIYRPPPSLLRHNGQISVQRVRFIRPFFTRPRKQALAFGSALIGALVLKLAYFSTDDKEEHGNAEVTPKIVTITVGKVKKESDGWRQENSGAQAGDKDLGQKKSRSGTRDGHEDEHEADEYEDQAESHNEEEDGDADDDEDDVIIFEEEDDEGEEEPIPEAIPEDALFIPLGLVHQRRPGFYKGTDPEWQSFVDFARDRKRALHVRNELAGLVGHALANTRGFQKYLGQPITARKYWLDIDFPDRPPPEYVRRGLEITEEYIALTTRPVSAHEYYRLKAILWPTSMATSLWASYKHLLSLRLARAKQYLNLKSYQENLNPNPTGSFSDFRRLASQKQDSQPNPGVEVSQAEPGRATAPEAASKTLPTRAPPNSTNALPPMPSLPEPGEDLSIALRTFRRTLAKTWKGPDIPVERGTFLVSGLVEVEGSKAVCVVDVRASYHPQESKWVTVLLGIRRLQPRKQAPKGGP